MELLLTPAFARQIKKLHKNQKASLDTVLHQLMENPFLGDAKTADLEGVYVLKFTMNRQEFQNSTSNYCWWDRTKIFIEI